MTTRSARVTLPTDEQILIERELEAPPAAVFRAYTTPELVSRWWTARRGRMTVCEIDLRPGGAWRYAMQTPDGQEVGFHGVYREVVPDERLVTTEVYEGVPDAEAVTTATFAPSAAGGTTLTILVEHATKAHRDGHVLSGMETGLQDALDLLEEVSSSASPGT